MDIPDSVVRSAQSAYNYLPGHGNREPMRAALERVLEDMDSTDEWAVPCLDKAGCRTVFVTREQAVEYAKAEGGVIEHRTVSHWRPA